MNIGEFKTSISEIENDIVSSKKSINDQVEILRSDLRDLRDCIEDKNREIEELRNDKSECLNLLDKIIGVIVDRQSQQKLLDDLCDIETEVKTLIAKSNEQTTGDDPRADAGVLINTATAEEGMTDLAKDNNTWAREFIDRTATG